MLYTMPVARSIDRSINGADVAACDKASEAYGSRQYDSHLALGCLLSTQGLPTTFGHGMVEMPHGVDLLFSVTQQDPMVCQTLM